MRGLGSGHVTCGPMRGLKKLHGEGTDIHTHKPSQPWTDFATTKKNWPEGRFFENLIPLGNVHCSVSILVSPELSNRVNE